MTQAQEPEPTRTHDAGAEKPPGVPGWVKISVIVVAILVLVLVVAMVVGGNHGPGRHMSAPVGGAGQPDTASASLGNVEHGVW